jgi:hypothetical protein
MRALSIHPYLQTLAPDAQVRVTRSLERTSNGFDQDLVTPLVPDRDHPDEGRQLRVSEVASWLFPTRYDWLDELETAQMAKIGPYSIMLPYEERKPQIYSYFAQRQVSIDSAAFEYASVQLSNLVRSTLHSSSIERAFDDMPRGTNLGLPFATADREYAKAVLELARHISRNGFQAEPDPCILYWRGQPRGLGLAPKQRTIWGYPHYLTIFELMLQIPMLNYLRKEIAFCAWVDQATTNAAVTEILQHSRHNILSVDFSGFDASIPGVVLRRVFEVLRGWFSTREKLLIDYVEDVFMGIGLLTPEGILIGRDGGVPSGSGITNLVDSLVQLFAFHYIAYRIHNRIELHLVQGDDGVVMWQYPWVLDDVVNAAAELGLSVSSDKGGVSRDRVYYLQNVHSRDYLIDGSAVGIRPIMKVLNGMLSYERFHKRWNSYDDSLRWIQQCENAKFHPEFRELCSFLFEHDRYVQNMDINQIIKKSGGVERAESALDQRSFPFGKVPVIELPRSSTGRELQRIKRRKTGGDVTGALAMSQGVA